MANLAAKTVLKTRPNAGTGAYIMADGVTFYEGMLCGLNTSGYLIHWADGASDIFIGIVTGGDDRAKDGVLTGETSDTPPTEARVDESGVVLMHLSIGGSPAQSSVGDKVYCGTSNVADMTVNSSGKNQAIGWVKRYRSATDVDVQLFKPSEKLA